MTEEAKLSAVAPRTQYVTFNERSVAFQVWGEGDREIAVALNYLSHLDWVWADPDVARMARHLGKIGRTLTYDRGGTGLSDPVLAPPTIEERAEELLAVLDAVGMSTVDLVGVYTGAAITAYVAATRPERVRSLLLLFPWVKGEDNEVDPPGLTDWWWQQSATIIERWGEGLTLEVFAPSLRGSPVHRRAIALQERASAGPGTARSLVASARQLDITAVLPSVHVPTLVFANKRDRALPIEQARHIAATIPSAQIVEFDSADSVLQQEHQEAFLAATSQFYEARVDIARSDCAFAALAFSDIVGSTQQLTRLGDRGWRVLLDSHDNATRRVLERHGGTEIQTTGDGFLVRFADAETAIRYALDLVRDINELGLQLRIGIHAGEVEHRAGEEIAGIAVHAAARICAAAAADEVLVSEPVRELTANAGFNFTLRGIHELRGAPGRWTLYAAAEGDLEAIPDTPRLATRADRVQQLIVRHAPALSRAAARIARRTNSLTSGNRSRTRQLSLPTPRRR